MAAIYTRYGFSYRLANDEWFSAALPPLSYLSANAWPNSMMNFRGVPTYVGFPSCDDDGVCTDVNVASLDPESNEWSVWTEQLLQPRRDQLVVEIPAYVCDTFSPLVHNFDDTAALVIGGFPGRNTIFDDIIGEVEIYGCEDPESLPTIAPFPT